jgi:hypothetical protein
MALRVAWTVRQGARRSAEASASGGPRPWLRVLGLAALMALLAFQLLWMTSPFRDDVAFASGWHRRAAAVSPHVGWVVLVAVLLRGVTAETSTLLIEEWGDSASLHREQHVTFTEQGLRWTDNISTLDTPWAAFQSVDETGHLFLLNEDAAHARFIPKRAFANDQALTSFRAFLAAMITHRPTAFEVMPVARPVGPSTQPAGPC